MVGVTDDALTPQPNAFPVRGYMLDISRDRVPTRESLAFLVDLLAACGYNQFELYMEHTFAHAGEDEVWQHASPVTADDMRWLDDICAARGIALVANRNSLGHMERWLSRPSHAHRAENPDGYDQWGEHWPPSTVAVNDDNLAFVNHLLDELVATTHAKRVNIGMDEPWEFGTGASKELVEREGTGKVYTDWVLAVAQPWLDKGFRVEMWGDILGHHPEQAERLPDGIDLVLWGYDSPEQIRRCHAWRGSECGPNPGFDDLSAPFAERGSQLFVAPGTGTWLSVTGRLESAIPNILDAVEVGSRLGAGGILVTDWGDRGHWEGYVHSLVPIIAGGFAAQNPDAAHELADPGVLTELVSRVLFGVVGHPGAELLVRVGLLSGLLDAPVENSTALWHALFRGEQAVSQPDVLPPIAPERLEVARDELRELLRRAIALPQAGWVDELITSLALADVALTRLEGQARPVPSELVHEVRRNWLSTSRPGGLDDSLAHLADVQTEGVGEDEVHEHHWRGLLGR